MKLIVIETSGDDEYAAMVTDADGNNKSLIHVRSIVRGQDCQDGIGVELYGGNAR